MLQEELATEAIVSSRLVGRQFRVLPARRGGISGKEYA
jgi:hypothetical protein